MTESVCQNLPLLLSGINTWPRLSQCLFQPPHSSLNSCGREKSTLYHSVSLIPAVLQSYRQAPSDQTLTSRPSVLHSRLVSLERPRPCESPRSLLLFEGWTGSLERQWLPGQ